MVAVRRYLATLTGASILWVGLSAGQQGSERFAARLSTSPVEAATAKAVTGSGSATAMLVGNKLSITGTFAGLAAPAIVARLHRGPAKGIRGPAVFDLTVSKSTSGTIAGSIELKPNQVEDLRQGRLYLQIHSEKAPDGNLWGWLLK